ncbi:MAG: low-specificity L-threonine aldolase [Natronospirillum sp.]|uniref:low-specificity L-threonine aldolase n=1 Tax=Natronospirillum sp. TaxID=2812955 RepID=UPI0025F6E39D|nr:low-specificity L-threonine aldolase [Natronospirillum sp.]MCH8550312.1 low-specificity L-threonine aldolase [Natronospirillum sp.]
MIDLRSDTVTRPGPAMRSAMMQAAVGDDVYGDDPTVNALEARVAALAGKERALLMPSGTQSNLVALLVHCQRGDEYIVGQSYHTYRYEGGGAAVLGSIQPQPLPVQADGSLALADIEAVIKPDDMHFARTRLLALENTQSGQVLTPEYQQSAAALARRHGLAVHLDGARLFNAVVELGQPLSDLTQPFDTVSLCFSKGLGTPMGSVLVGSADFIEQARRWRKVVGGGLRQAGLIAASMDYALDHHVQRLAEDHRRAGLLAEALGDLPGVVGVRWATNMVYLELASEDRGLRLQDDLEAQGILIRGGQSIRLVTHLDISDEDIGQVVNAVGTGLRAA